MINISVPKVAAIHDLSCFGRCSLTVIIPTLSAMGVQVCPLPTALLSTHLGGYRNLAFYDFTEMMPAFFTHWRDEKIAFDCLYSGFLASERQIAVVDSFIHMFSDNKPLILVDPVMGDDGRLYSTFTPEVQKSMKRLVQKADIITPNYTEACFLLGEQYIDRVSDIDSVERQLERLSSLGPPVVVITGIPIGGGKIMNAGFDRRTKQFLPEICDYIPARYPGTGDIYASVLIGGLLRNYNLTEAMKQASNFVSLALAATYKAGTPNREGVLLELVLPQLCAGFLQPG